MDISSRLWSVYSLAEQSATCKINNADKSKMIHLASETRGSGRRGRSASGCLNTRGGEVLREKGEVGAAAVVGAGDRPVLAGWPGGGETREDDGEVRLHEAVDKLGVGQRLPVEPLYLPHHLHPPAGATAAHLVHRGSADPAGYGMTSFACHRPATSRTPCFA